MTLYLGPDKADLDEAKWWEESQRHFGADAWRTPFKGTAPERLWNHIVQTKLSGRGFSNGPSYGAIIQPSGMGKSRCVDQLALKHFVIPMNVTLSTRSWPPGDDSIRKFLLQDLGGDAGKPYRGTWNTLFSNNVVPPHIREAQYRHFQAFFMGLFVEIAIVIDREDQNRSTTLDSNSLFLSHEEMCLWFHDYLAPDVGELVHNKNRRWLFARAITRARKVVVYFYDFDFWTGEGAYSLLDSREQSRTRDAKGGGPIYFKEAEREQYRR